MSANMIGEEQAKRVWLSRVTETQWGNIAPTRTSSTSAASEYEGEEEAKKAWLARLDAPTWRKAAAAVEQIAKDALVIEKADKDAVKKVSEDEAKKAWIARLDAPAWGSMVAAASAVAAASTGATQDSAMSAEEMAKQSWLAKLDIPGQKSRKESDEMAKKAWLDRLDAPSWRQAADDMADIVQEATALQDMTEACGEGDDRACEMLSHEQEAKKAWLARLDLPTWGAAAVAVSAVAKQVGA